MTAPPAGPEHGTCSTCGVPARRLRDGSWWHELGYPVCEARNDVKAGPVRATFVPAVR